MNQKSSRSLLGPATAALALYCIACVPVQAQGWIAGGSVGSARQLDYQAGGTLAPRDNSDAGARLFGGYLVSPMQGVIASFVDLGTANYRGPDFGGFEDDLDADGIDVSYIVGWAPGNQQRISVFGSVGVFTWDQDVTLRDATGTFKAHDEGTSFSVGFGATVNLSADGTSAWALNVEYQLFKDVGDAANSGHENDREMLSVGVNHRFGRRD